MRKKSIIGIVLPLFVVIALIPCTAHSLQGIGLSVGLALPVGNLSDVSGNGFSFGGDYFAPVFDTIPKLRVGGRFAYNKFAQHDYAGFGANVSSSASSFELVPSLRYLITEENKLLGFFGQLGAGLYFTRLEFNNFPLAESKNETDFGVTIGGGVTYKLFDRISAVAMPLYHITDHSFVSLNVGFIFGRREW